jgi:hypothetical protein
MLTPVTTSPMGRCRDSGCGCRGDFEITNKGLAFLAFESPLSVPCSPTPEAP